MLVTQGDVRVPLSRKSIQTLYDSMSSIYDLLTRYEKGSLKKSLDNGSSPFGAIALGDKWQ